MGAGRVKTRGLGLLQLGDVPVSQEWTVHGVEHTKQDTQDEEQLPVAYSEYGYEGKGEWQANAV